MLGCACPVNRNIIWLNVCAVATCILLLGVSSGLETLQWFAIVAVTMLFFSNKLPVLPKLGDSTFNRLLKYPLHKRKAMLGEFDFSEFLFAF